jgi:uncharacterized iron-regulated membrane protein
MAWLHTWGSLWFCWLLFAIFFTGTLAVFDEPISHWMTPEHHAADANPPKTDAPVIDRKQRLAHAVAFLERSGPPGRMWEIWPGGSGHGDDLVVYWMERGQYIDRHLNPATGDLVTHEEDDHDAVRATSGGHHFVDFHYTLHAGAVGQWIAAAAALAMLVSLVSGVIIHKRIFKDFFTFRPRKGQRSWLDGHNAVAVLTLPFQLMIAFTGIAIYSTTYMPAATWAVPFVAKPQPVKSGGPDLAIPDLEPFARRGEHLMAQPLRAIVIQNPGEASMRISTHGWNDDAERANRIVGSSAMAGFSADGTMQEMRSAGGVDGGSAAMTKAAIGSMHMAEFGGFTMKWLYFLCGMAGSAMIATGSILFIVKRRQKAGHEFGAVTARVYQLIEALNVAAIAGLAIACIGYLWANRLISADLAEREAWEVRAFFALWIAAMVHAPLRPSRRAWIEQLAVLAILCAGLPLLNFMATGDHWIAQWMRGDLESLGVEVMAFTFGAGAAWAAWSLRGKSHTRPKPRRTPVGAVRLEAAE